MKMDAHCQLFYLKGFCQNTCCVPLPALHNIYSNAPLHLRDNQKGMKMAPSWQEREKVGESKRKERDEMGGEGDHQVMKFSDVEIGACLIKE